MRRRRLLKANGTVFMAMVGTSFPAAAVGQDDAEDESADPDLLEFTGEGETVTDKFGLKDGPTLVEGTHEGESTFDVRAISDETEREYVLISQTGEFEGATGAFTQDGTYVLSVDADGPWELTVRQPRVSETEAMVPPISFEGNGSNWIGPILFDGSHIAGTCEDRSVFRVEVVPQNADDSEFIWGGSELVFDAIGRFLGVTDVHTDGVGYVTVAASGDWLLEIE